MIRAILMFLCGMALAPLTAMAEDSDNDLLIRDVQIVSPDRSASTGRRSVYIRDGRIVEISRRPSRDARGAAQVINGEGRFLAPGLIDGHVHLGEIPGMIAEHEKEYPEIAAAARAQIPLSYLYYGFTTIVDLNGRKDWIVDWNAAPLRPQAHFCGGAPVFDGYPTNWLPKPLRYEVVPYFLYDESRADEFPEGVDPAAHSPQTIAARIQGDGGICIKTHYEPGFGGRGDLPVPTVALVRELVAAAHERGMPVLLHANSQASQAFGLEAGIDAFAHGMWTWNDRAALALNDEVAAILDGVIENRIGWQPTVQVLYGERDLHDPDYLQREGLADVLPQSLIEWYASEDGQWWRKRMGAVPYIKTMTDEGAWEKIDAEPIARVTAATAYLAEQGGHLLFGSDTPSDPTFANPPGLNGRLEMQRWREAGVSAKQIFTAATLGAAEFFGLAEEVGTVSEGKRADLLLLGANPLQDIAAYDQIEKVILGGRVLERAALSAKRR